MPKTLTIEAATLANVATLSSSIKELSRDYGDVEVGQITVDQIVKRGLRRVPTLVSNVSSVDPESGQKLRGIPIREFSKEGSMLQAFWCSMTGRIGSKDELELLSIELQSASEIYPQTIRFIQDVVTNHPEVKPMAILSAVFAMMPEEKSHFYICKISGKKGDELIRAAVLDSKRIFAQSVGIVGMIYSLKYGDKKIHTPFFDATKSWGSNLSHAMGLPTECAAHLEIVGLVHTAQGKGNVSSHTSHLVGSMGANPDKCISACITALSAPGHAQASADAMNLIEKIIEEYGENPELVEVENFLTRWLEQKNKIPGIGQAVMRNIDPRFMMLHEFTDETPKIKIVKKIVETIPEALRRAGVELNSPNPNVNLILGSFAESFGVYNKDFFPVLFTVGRLMDPLSQFVENTIWNSTMLRPESLTTEELLALAKKSREKASSSGMVRNTIQRFKDRGGELYEALIVNLINHLPEDQVDLYGRAIIDRLSLFQEIGGRQFYRVDIRSRAALSANAAITYSDTDGNMYLGLSKKWKDPHDHDKGIHNDYQNIGGYMDTIISRTMKRVIKSSISHGEEQDILRGSKTSFEAYSKEFWASMTPEKFTTYIHDQDLVSCLFREINEETGLFLSERHTAKLVNSVVRHRSRGDLSLLVNYYSIHLGKTDKMPNIIPGDDVAMVDFVDISRIQKITNPDAKVCFYVNNTDGTRTSIDTNNALEYEKAIKVARNSDFKERFNIGIKEFIMLTVVTGGDDAAHLLPRIDDAFGAEASGNYKAFIKKAEELAPKHSHTIKLIRSREEAIPILRSKL